MKIGYQGVPGSYSETALQEYKQAHQLQDVTAIGYSSFKALIDEIEDGHLDLIVIPVENSTTGLIARTVDLLRYRSLVAVDENYQSIQHYLWGLETSEINTITEAYSHPEALSQCDTFFANHPHITAKAYEDTAKSAQFIAEEGSIHQAALASKRAGELYGLKQLAASVQTESMNTTRFYIMAPNEKVTLKGDILSLYIETKHESGALAKLLQVFTLFDCNMESLNARPISGKPFAYGFFMEVDVSKSTVPFELLWQTLEQVSEHLQVLGRFDSALTNKKG